MRSLVLLGLLAASAPAMAMVLTEDGEARCAIVVPDDALNLQTYAAEELQYFLQRISGAQVPIVKASESVAAEAGGPAHRIWVGPSQAARDAGIDPGELAPESIRILTSGEDLIIVGGDVIGPGDKDDPFSYNNQTGTLFAVYDFLQDQLGVRWLWPGETGTVIPPLSTITVGALDISEVPQLRQRHLRTPFKSTFIESIEKSTGPLDRDQFAALGHDTDVWMKRMRMGRNLFINYGHAFGRWWETYGDEHPEWFALTAERGQRGPVSDRAADRVKLCVSNPELWEEIIAQWKLRREQNATVYQTLNGCENDGTGWCTCPDCQAWDVPGYTTLSSRGEEETILSDRYCRFWNELARRAREVDPAAYVVAYAYSAYRFPPRQTRLEPNIIVGFVPAVGYPNPGDSSQQFRRDWQDWSSHGVRLFLRPNWLGGLGAVPQPCTDQLADDFRFAVTNGMIGTDYDTLSGMWCASGPTYYLLARLHWDTGASTDQLMDEYLSAFGAAAPKVREYFEYWERYNRETWPRFHDRVVELATGATGRGYERVQPEVYTDECFRAATVLLVEAARAAEAEPEIVRQRVEDLQKALRHAQMTVQAIAATENINSGEGELNENLQVIRRMHRYRMQIGAENVINAYWAMWRDTKFGDYAGYKLVQDMGDRVAVALLPKTWRFRFDPDEVGEGLEWFRPGSVGDEWTSARTDMFWEDQPAGQQWQAEHGAQYDGLAWYRAGFSLDPQYEGRKLLLFFGSVDEDAKIWLNGELVADHKMEGDDGWKRPFTIDITGHVLFDKGNALAIAVRDTAGRGGIYKRVWVMQE